MNPSTPTPRRFLLSKRNQPSSQTPSVAPRFQSTPRFGSSSVSRPPTQRELGRAIEDFDEDEGDRVTEKDARPSEGEESSRVSSSPVVSKEVSRAPKLDRGSDDPIEADSGDGESDGHRFSSMADEVYEIAYHSSSPEQRRAKRRKISTSPPPTSSPSPERNERQTYGGELIASDSEEPSQSREPGTGHGDLMDSPTPDPSPGMHGGNDDDNDDNDDDDDDERDGSADQGRTARLAARAAQQPTFQPAPRFKPVDTEASSDGLPLAFSPQRRGEKYVPGGLASELQGWLSNVRRWDEDTTGRREHVAFRVTVDEVEPGARMYLVRARAGGDGEDPGLFILAGEGKLTGLGRRADVGPGSIVEVEPPVWDVELDGQTWTVTCDWTVV